MNRRKLSCILTVTMIATQLNSVAFAQKNYDQINDISSFVTDEVQNDTKQEENESYNEEAIVKEDESSETIIEKNENSQSTVVEENTSHINAKAVGKLEVDMNFHMPIKNVGKDATNISVKLLKDNQEIGVVQLGNDNKQGDIKGKTYNFQAMDGKRIAISDNAEELSFYHLTFNDLEIGTYSVEIEGKGYTKTVINDIKIDNSSKRIKVGTSDNKIVLSDNGTPDNENDDIVEYYPGVFLAGQVNEGDTVTKEDYEAVKDAIKNKSNDLKYDINKDSKVDITDLTYIHKNIDKEKKSAVIVETDAIIDPNKVSIDLNTDKVTIGEGQNIKNILVGDGSKISLSTKGADGADAPEISEENPIRIPINLSSTSSYSSNGNNTSMEKVVIKAPSATRPTSGSVVINNETYNYDESNVNKSVARTTAGEEIDEIVIDLGKQVAVSEITINVTGSRGSKNLAEITKVEFLNNVYKEMPKPNMNIPVINNFTSTTSVGNESMTIGWDHEANVTGYEIKVETLKDDGTVESTKLYRTSENTLKITQVKPYAVYRFSIQSINGSEWSSGYKDQQDDYVASDVGESNLKTNVNDKDGKADNVDTNYIPKAWNSTSGVLDSTSNEEIENSNYFGADSIIELQVVPETKPEGPEGIIVSGVYKGLKVSWKAHQKAKDYDLYYRKVGDGAWIKANDPNEPKYSDSNPDNDIPDGVENLDPTDKTDSNELIRATSYEIAGLEDGAAYEIKMTATNHHGTGGLSKTYLGETAALVPPDMTNYKLINTPKEDGGVNHIEKVTVKESGILELSNNDPMSIVDNDYDTTWVLKDWDAGVNYGQRSPIVTFDKEYTFDTIRFTTKLENMSAYPLPHEAKLRVYADDDTEYNNPIKVIERTNIRFSTKTAPNGVKYLEVKLPEAITAKQVELNIAGSKNLSISEMKFYHYDSLEGDVEGLFADDLRLVLNDEVTQETIDELMTRAKTIDPVSLEYHPSQESILEDLEMAQNLLNDANLDKDVITLDASILDYSPNLGQANSWQSLGVAVKPGDNISIYVGTEAGREHSQFEVLFTQNYAESGSWNSGIVRIGVGKNDIQVPEGRFNMDVEKGGNVYIRPVSGFYEKQKINVRVSGGTKIPHLNVNNIITDRSKETEVKAMIREYIRDLKLYVADLPSLYPSVEDKVNNQYKYDAKTSILNSTEIESERVMLTLTATEVLTGITSGLNGDENAEVDRLYESLLAWEQLMEISYSLKGVIETAIDFNGNGKIDNNKNDTASLIDGLTEQEYFNKHRAPRSRINVKYQRMFTGAFMYASSHHVGIDVGSGIGLVQGVPFNFDSEGNITNPNEGSLYGWGISHEVGHVQDQANLTQAEVTNNILALITQTFNGTSESRLEGGTYLKMYDKVTSGSIGSTSDIAAKLGMYWQLHLAYEENETYEMLQNNKDIDPNNDSFYAKLYKFNRIKIAAPKEDGYNQVEQTFIMRASDAAGKDLREFFEKWGIVSSPNTNKYLDEMKYPKETRAIYYLNDEARRRRLDTSNSETMAKDTEVIANFGTDNNGNKITNKTYLNQKEIPLNLSVTKDSDKILGYEIIRKESTSTGIKEVPVGFVEIDRSTENGITSYVDTIDAINNRVLGYKVVAYDYDLNKTEETVIGEIKVTHNGSIGESSWILSTNTTNDEDERDEHTGHGTVQNGVITRINDNNPDTVFQGMKDGNQDPYVIIDLSSNKSLVGLTYTAPKTTTKKLSLKNLFSRSDEKVYKPISDYEIYTSLDGEKWTLSSSGKFDNSKTTQTVYFSEDGKTDAKQLWAYNARYVKLVAKRNTEISIAELDLLTAAGDNIEIGIDNDDQVYKNGVGRLKSDYKYAEGKVIPKGSIIVTGEYRGNPAFNVPLLLNENDKNFALKSKAVLLATLPENSELTEVAEGNWIYWIEPQDQGKVDVGNGLEQNLEGTAIKAELYRYNKLNEAGAPVGQRLVSDTFLVQLPSDLNTLPEIELNSSSARAISSEDKTVIEITNDLINKTFENR
ncbi:M60 family metallopeptidase [Clostridium sp.]|uniref:M60 family metallopeptidase n=1 Tax=Clostridium sp. TaxID=1506 RepID=UPI002605878F|nr:M60 family metallopeptidase [Clostridium sp.]